VKSNEQQLNETETEEDGIRAEAIRRLKVRQLSKVQPVQTEDSVSRTSGSTNESSTPMKTTPEPNTDARAANRRLDEVIARVNKRAEERLGRPLRKTALDEILSSGSAVISLPVSQAVSKEVQSQDQE
jgi:hypothetical protein